MQLILAGNMHAVRNVQIVLVVIVCSLFGKLMTNDIDQLKEDMKKAQQQLQLLNNDLGKFFSCNYFLQQECIDD